MHGEADGLPGLIVDRYGDTLSAQFPSAGAERWREAIAERLSAITGLGRVYERSDSGVRGLEGLAPRSGWLRGGGATEITIHEHGRTLGVDVFHGHKTGNYPDQRDNRQRFADWVRQFGCRRVLNCYCYTGGFSLAALAGGAAEVVSVDSSAPALEQARQRHVHAIRRRAVDIRTGSATRHRALPSSRPHGGRRTGHEWSWTR